MIKVNCDCGCEASAIIGNRYMCALCASTFYLDKKPCFWVKSGLSSESNLILAQGGANV